MFVSMSFGMCSIYLDLVFLFVRSSMSLSVRLLVLCLSVCIFVCLSILLSVCLSMCTFICLLILYLHVFLPSCLFVCTSVCLSVFRICRCHLLITLKTLSIRLIKSVQFFPFLIKYFFRFQLSLTIIMLFRYMFQWNHRHVIVFFSSSSASCHLLSSLQHFFVAVRSACDCRPIGNKLLLYDEPIIISLTAICHNLYWYPWPDATFVPF